MMALAIVDVVPLSGQAAADDVARLTERFDAARAAAVHLLAPRAFDRAAGRLADATRRSERGGSAAEVRERLREAAAGLDEATSLAEAVRGRFAEALDARERARAEDASTHVAEAWEAAEAELARGGRDAERGDVDRASETDRRAADLYRRAARAARADRLLGDAENARQAALSAGGSELAPETFAAGERELADGQAGLDDASDRVVGGHGAAAERAFRRAAWLAALSDSLRTRSISVERLVDAHEADLARLAAAAGVGAPDLRDPGGGTAAEVERAIRDLLSRNAALESDLEAERRANEQLRDQVTSLETTLSDTEQRFVDARDALLERQARDARLRETQALFTPEDGEVFLSGDDLVLRLYGLTFDSGSDEIEDSMEPLLTKVQRVVLEFPGATIRIEGHTDSQGGAEANRALSQRRAIAVREYLLSRIPISSSRVQATGYGEDRPIASNDNEEGRARNRRIEIILSLPPD